MKSKEERLVVPVPADFDFTECLVILERSNSEILHEVNNREITKLLSYRTEMILFTIAEVGTSLMIDFPNGAPSPQGKEAVRSFIKEWFDLETDMAPFYALAARDPLLSNIVRKHHGLRLVGIPDLFEALAWAVIGQQINLAFAYTLKKRFVQNFGRSIEFGGKTYWIFPSAERIASIQVGELQQLQFTIKKAEYIIGIAKEMASGAFAKEQLLEGADGQQAEASLTAIRGIGPWSANYVMMKCLKFPSAFPIADAGLHNALKKHLGLARKPTLNEIEAMAVNWKGWQAYATFYLWRTLYE